MGFVALPGMTWCHPESSHGDGCATSLKGVSGYGFRGGGAMDGLMASPGSIPGDADIMVLPGCMRSLSKGDLDLICAQFQCFNTDLVGAAIKARAGQLGRKRIVHGPGHQDFRRSLIRK